MSEARGSLLINYDRQMERTCTSNCGYLPDVFVTKFVPYVFENDIKPYNFEVGDL